MGSIYSKTSRRLRAVFLAMLAAAPAVVQPANPEPLGAWSLEPSTVRCVISRRYDDPKAGVTLGIKASPLGDTLQIVVIRPGHRREGDMTGARLTIGEAEVETTALSYKLDSRGRRVAHLITLGGGDVAALRAASRIHIKVTEGADLGFALLPIAAAWKQLDLCLTRLREVWNVDPAGSPRLATPPEPVVPLGSLVSDADYPRAAIRDSRGGATGFVLLVDEQGDVRDCTLTETSGAATLDARTCAIFTARAHFKPATDRDGRPVKGAFASRIRWVITT